MVSTPDDPGKYARRELERRFLLDGVPAGLERVAHIEDRYLEGTRLRLRRVDGADGSVTRKLGQKIRIDPDDPAEVWLTNLYLDRDEHAALAILPGRTLVKDRHGWPGEPWAVDVFAGPLAGLVLAEVECADRDAFAAVTAPPGTVAEVTHDDRFAGGTLARTGAQALAVLRASLPER